MEQESAEAAGTGAGGGVRAVASPARGPLDAVWRDITAGARR